MICRIPLFLSLIVLKFLRSKMWSVVRNHELRGTEVVNMESNSSHSLVIIIWIMGLISIDFESVCSRINQYLPSNRPSISMCTIGYYQARTTSIQAIQGYLAGISWHLRQRLMYFSISPSIDGRHIYNRVLADGLGCPVCSYFKVAFLSVFGITIHPCRI